MALSVVELGRDRFATSLEARASEDTRIVLRRTEVDPISTLTAIAAAPVVETVATSVRRQLDLRQGELVEIAKRVLPPELPLAARPLSYGRASGRMYQIANLMAKQRQIVRHHARGAHLHPEDLIVGAFMSGSEAVDEYMRLAGISPDFVLLFMELELPETVRELRVH